MNALLIGAVAMISSVGAPVAAPPKHAPVTIAAKPAAEEKGSMTREISVDRRSGETTEINIIAFNDG